MRAIAVPAATDSAVDHADWLELTALQAADGNTSMQDLVSSLRRTGSTEELADTDSPIVKGDQGSEESYAVADAAFVELEDRLKSCGETAYPFEINDLHLQAREDAEEAVYLFLLLLTHFGQSDNIRKAEGVKLFEEVCAVAAREYFGGESAGALSLAFGFPRRYGQRRFSDALLNLSRSMGEGSGYRARDEIDLNKDGKLDVVVWKHFRDERKGKAIAFGQCATGKDWRAKTSELQPRAFWDKWIMGPPTLEPLRLFFVPRRVEPKVWEDVCIEGGILFDRCRIASLLSGIRGPLLEECSRWSQHALERKLR